MSTAIATKRAETTVAPRSFASVDELLKDKAVQQQIARALPKGMDSDRMLRIAISAISKNPVLRDCTPMSVGLSIIKAAEQGLQVDGWEGHLVPFKNKGRMECQFIADYKGLVKLAYQSELVVEIHAEVICANDEFDYEKGTETFLRWKPARGDRGEMLGAWAGAKMKGEGFPFVVMWRDEIMQHKAKSPAGKSDFSPWNTAEGEPWMWRKTALRTLCKFLPRSSQLLELLKHDEAEELGGAVVDGVLVAQSSDPEQPRLSRPEQLARRLANGTNRPTADAGESQSKSLDQRQREPGDDSAPIAPPQVEPTTEPGAEADILSEYLDQMDQKETITDATEWRNQANADANLSPASKAKVQSRYEMRVANIRGARGQRGNGAKLFDAGGASATEKGL